MLEDFANAQGIELVFWACAIVGSIFFVLKTALMLIGMDHDADADGDVYHDVDSPDGTEASFHVFSVNSIAAFIMMFGWAGLAAFNQYGLSLPASTGIALVSGAGFMLVIAYIFHLAYRFTRDGEVFTLEDILGKTASVYQRIPAEGEGKIQITANGILREIAARARDKDDIESFTKVEVCEVIDPNTVLVKPIS